ncbi:MAG: glutamine--fructose-6-phosphate transaminase (isomerizing) [Acidobacteria bacterium]|nr:glutamine--fructose-6-phosphate transaminase (isomerizing) [Acidobacteriota bacterium]
MCGIVGYIGWREPSALLIDGLRRLEYRGYDSCGIAILDNGTPRVVRAAGRIANLESKAQSLPSRDPGVRCGIGHTRWATHGRPNEENAHPHRDCSGHFLVAHNGIIENYLELKRKLLAHGHFLRTETDTEVLPHLIESYFTGNLEQAVQAALREVEGVYALVAISTHDKGKVVAARKGPPIVLGLGQHENFVASDIPALLPYTRQIVFLDDGEIAVVHENSVDLLDKKGCAVSRTAQHIPWSAEMAQKEGYAHFMLKEMFEQPRAIRDTLCGRVTAAGVTLENELNLPGDAALDRLHIVACGTSLHAGLVGKFLVESMSGLPVEIDYASEFRYRNPRLGRKSMVVAISQSGETADTLAALQEARDKGAFLMSICNVIGSMAARQSDTVLYTRAGPEIGVAATKTFTTQIVALYLLALALGRRNGFLSDEEISRRVRMLTALPDQMEKIFEQNGEIHKLGERFCSYGNFLYLGRGINFPIAMEGALKLKEISYIHAEGYAAGEMKHGPIALINRLMPVVALAPRDQLYPKMLGNVEEVKARDGMVLAVTTVGDQQIAHKADSTIFIPESDPSLYPLLTVVPLQLLAYHIAVLRGCDVDKPRNLAKSVTVE